MQKVRQAPREDVMMVLTPGHLHPRGALRLVEEMKAKQGVK